MTTQVRGHLEPAPLTIPPAGAAFRPDVDGLRAVAIVLVVLYHAGVPGFSGGFVGVDAFFVISGYLITRNLVLETERSGRVRLGSFWAKRIRRLVPAMTVLVVATLIASALVMTSFELDWVAEQGTAASLYLSNAYFAQHAQDYFSTDISDSPFLHTWSLGVEEQFYVLWPLAVVATGALSRRGTHRMRRHLALAFGAIGAVSFAISLHLTSQGSPWAFFGLQSRAWEFALAGLLALAPLPPQLDRRRARLALALLGLSLLAVATATATETDYPGLWALLPVTGTILVILAGDRTTADAHRNPASDALATPPLQALGRVSYSWYLWHWPFIVLAVRASGDDSVDLRLAAATASLAVAALAYRYIESPLRFSPGLTRSTPRTFAFGGAATALGVGSAFAVVAWSSTQPTTPLDEQIATARVPPVADYECPERRTSTDVSYCTGGDPTSDTTVMLIGDSHALQWFPALAAVSEERGIHLAGRFMAGCGVVPVDARPPLAVDDPGLDAKLDTCRGLRAATMRSIEDLDPDAIVFAQWDGYVGGIFDESGRIPDEAEQRRLWADGFQQFITDIEARDIPLAVFADNPSYDANPLTCMLQSGSADACEQSPQDALAVSAGLQDTVAEVLAANPEVTTIDWSEILCNADRCALADESMVYYQDSNHLSRAYTLTQTDRLHDLLDELDVAG